MNCRAKFKCSSVKKQVGWSGYEFVYEAEFVAVTSGSEENKSFFAATPSGSVKLQTVKEDFFTPGKEYYLDFIEA